MRLSEIALPLVASILVGVLAPNRNSYARDAYPLNGMYEIPTGDCAELLNSLARGGFRAGSIVAVSSRARELLLGPGPGSEGTTVRFPIGRFPVAPENPRDSGQFTVNRYADGNFAFESTIEDQALGGPAPMFQMIRGSESLRVDLNWGQRACELQPRR